MKYYKLSCATATKETGSVFPQIDKLPINYDENASNSIYALGKCIAEFPKFEPNLERFRVNGRAKMTDLMSNSFLNAQGFFVSNKLKNILDNHFIMSHNFYKSSLILRENLMDYYWLHILLVPEIDLTEFIDYSLSKFYILEDYFTISNDIIILSKQDYVDKKALFNSQNPNKNISIRSKELYFLPNSIEKLDFFKIGSFDSDFYVSESFKNEIVKEKITGCKIEEATWLI
jgi:hypothetical protein